MPGKSEAIVYQTNSAKFRTQNKETGTLSLVDFGTKLDSDYCLNYLTIPYESGSLIPSRDMNMGETVCADADSKVLAQLNYGLYLLKQGKFAEAESLWKSINLGGVTDNLKKSLDSVFSVDIPLLPLITSQYDM